MSDLSKRKKNIINFLIKENDFVSTSKISTALNVSRRTILREMGDIEKWLESNGLKLSRISSKGVKLNVTTAERDTLTSLISNTSVDDSYTPLERQRKLLLELLNATEPKKIYYFASVLNVSEATVSYDLDKIETWLKTWQLILIRKPGYGVLVEGMEGNFRKAIIHIFNEYFDRGELLHLIRDEFIDGQNLVKKASIKKTLLDVVGYTMLESVEEAILASGLLDVYDFADSAYAALTIHLSLAIKRISDGEHIHFDQKKLEELHDTNEFEMASEIAFYISDIFTIKVPNEEIGYIAMHIKGSRLRPTHRDDSHIKVRDYEVIYLIEILIKEMETRTGYMLVGDQNLLTGLVNHFGPALTRIKQNIEINNPLLKEMKVRYPKYYDHVSSAVKVVEQHLDHIIPDDEIGYLTMHFAATLESIKKLASASWQVAIVCSTGIGSSKLLEARIKKQFKNMTIKSILSARDVEELELDVDVLISTIQLKTVKPHIVVSPLLLEEDIKRIESLLATIVPLRISQSPVEGDFTKTLQDFSVLSKNALMLLNSFYIVKTDEVSIEKMIDLAIEKMTVTSTDLVKKGLLVRESKGSTPFDDGKGRLLHCQVEKFGSVHFGFVISEDNYAAVMVADDQLDLPTRRLLGQISMNLTENKRWLELVKSNHLEDAYRELENIIKVYFKSLVD